MAKRKKKRAKKSNSTTARKNNDKKNVAGDGKDTSQIDELEKILTQDVDTPDQPSKEDKGKSEAEESTVLADLIKVKHKQRTVRWIVGGVVAVILLAGAAFAGFLYFGQNSSNGDDLIQLEINGPEKAIIGEEIEYTIAYANTGDVDIRNAKLIYKETEGFEVAETEPEAHGRSWDLDLLAIGQKGEVKIRGRMVDLPDAEQKIEATLIFVPTNFNSEFTKQTSFSISLMPPQIALETTSPETVTLGEKVPIGIKITNDELVALPEFRVQIDYPTAYQVANVAPETAQENNTWDIVHLEPATALAINVEGSFPPDMTFENINDRNQLFNVRILMANDKGQYLTIIEEKFDTKVVDQALSALLIVNGSTDNKTISLQDTLTFSLVYKNKGDKAYNNPRIVAVIKSDPDQVLDWNSINDEEFGQIEKTDEGRTITWTSQQIEALEVFDAGEEGTIDFTIPVKAFEDIDNASVTQLGKNVVEAYAAIRLKDDSGNDLPSIDSSSIALSLNSNVQLGNKVLYYFEDGTPIGIGPLPPVVNEKTNYVVFWELTNDLHELKDISVESSLPEAVSWLDKSIVSSGEINYDAGTKGIKWTLNKLPISAGKASMTFHIQLEPKENNIGKLMKLLNNTTVKATDTVTGDVITITDGVLTTNLDEDEFGVGMGIIAAIQL